MRIIVILFIVLCVFKGLSSQNLQKSNTGEKNMYNRFGQIIKNEKGEKKTYPFSDTIAKYRNTNDIKVRKLIEKEDFKSSGLKSCEPSWEYAIMGTCIGRRSLNTFDIDNDGIVEIICSAQPGSYYGGYWGVLVYFKI